MSHCYDHSPKTECERCIEPDMRELLKYSLTPREYKQRVCIHLSTRLTSYDGSGAWKCMDCGKTPV